jgi:hypothetical protein
MASHLHQISRFIILSLVVVSLAAETEKSTGEQITDWAAILEEAETSAEWAADPLADLGFHGDDLSIFITASARAGAGHSSNFLKGTNPVSSGYYRVEADVWANWFFRRSTLSVLFFGEANIYENIGDLDVDDEFLSFGKVSWSVPGDSNEIGIEALSFFADQIYDATLDISNGNAAGTRIRQFLPQASMYIDWFPGKVDRLRLEPSISRAEFDIEDQDYWEPALAGEWERLWKKSFSTLSKVGISRQYYDDEIGRDAGGNDLETEERLLVDRIKVEQRLTWKPPQWKWMEWTGSFGISWDKDQAGEYENMHRTWASARARLSGDWGQLRLTGRWMEIRYEDRDPLTRHTQESLETEYKLPLGKSFSAYVRGEWTSLNSTIESESYSEQRGELLLEWSY